MTSDDESAALRAEVDGCCVEPNREGAPEDVLSPSGRFRLTVRNYRSRPGVLNVSRGTVARVSDGAVVADLCRNISSFEHTFIERNGVEWLIAGRAYTSQTLVNLETGAEYEPPGDPYGSDGFCWSDARLSPDGNTLLVEGCVWACPYEVRFFDFTNPARGWPELTLEGIGGLFEPSTVFRSRWRADEAAECHLADHQNEPQERVVLERRGDRMRVRSHDVSDGERARRAAMERRDADVRAWWKVFHTTDPRYLRLVALVEQHRIPNDTLDWQPGGRCLSEHFRRAEPRASADLTWNLEAETLFVQLYSPSGERAERLPFPSTLEGIEAAMAVVAEVFAPSRAPPFTEMSQLMDALYERQAPALAPNGLADVFDRLTWCLDAGDVLQEVREAWLQSDDRGRIETALAMEGSFPFVDEKVMRQVFARIAARWPDLAETCQRIDDSRESHKPR